MESYSNFIAAKHVKAPDSGFDVDAGRLNPMLFDWQREVVAWSLRKGRAAYFEDCGLGKTPQQLEWARHVSSHTGGPVLIAAPLAVSRQTKREGEKFGIEVNICRTQDDVSPGINITNYEMIEHFSPGEFSGIVLDKSSILKSFMGKTKRRLVELFAATPYRLACTATPAPNDHTELGNHSEFLGWMPSCEMLSRWFVNDTFNVGTWRLKGHAVEDFWRWVSTWAVCLTKPSDIGFDDNGFILPDLTQIEHVVGSALHRGQLVITEAPSATQLQKELVASLQDRCALAASLANESNEAWVLWCNRNDESEALAAMVPDAEEIRGSMPVERKEKILEDFSAGKIRVLVSKASMTGFGLNWQHCHNTAFVSPSYSFEARYQAIRRFWRFGQTQEVFVHDVMSPSEALVCAQVRRKEAAHNEMHDQMAGTISRLSEIHGKRDFSTYLATQKMKLPVWMEAAA